MEELKTRPVKGKIRCHKRSYEGRFSAQCIHDATVEIAYNTRWPASKVGVEWRPVCKAHLHGEKMSRKNTEERNRKWKEHDARTKAAERAAKKWSKILGVSVKVDYGINGVALLDSFVLSGEALEELHNVIIYRE